MYKIFIHYLIKYKPRRMSKLVPNVEGKCLKSYLMSIGDYSGVLWDGHELQYIWTI